MGKVYLVGGGPGDPNLLTVKALKTLAAAGVVVYDRLVSPEILALVNPSAVVIYGGKEQGQQEEIQAEINRALTHYAARVPNVVRLKSGDPVVFGRAPEEWLLLAEQGVEVDVVPGVSSAIAVPALAGIPLTARGVASSFAVIAGHRQSLQQPHWARYRGVDTLVILMGVEFRDIIANTLIDLGRPATQPVAFIERGSTLRRRVVTSTLAGMGRAAVEVQAPAIFVAGEVVRLRSALRATVREAALAS